MGLFKSKGRDSPSDVPEERIREIVVEELANKEQARDHTGRPFKDDSAIMETPAMKPSEPRRAASLTEEEAVTDDAAQPTCGKAASTVVAHDAHEPSQQTTLASDSSLSQAGPLREQGWVTPRIPVLSRVLAGPQAGEIVIGDAGAITMTPRRMAKVRKDISYTPIATVDMAQNGPVTAAAVSVRGLEHQDFSIFRQDATAFTVTADGRYVVGAIADGVSQGKDYAHLGADTAVKTCLRTVVDYLEAGTAMDRIPWADITDKVRSTLRRKAEGAFGPGNDDAALVKQIGTTAEVLIVGTSPATAEHTGASANRERFLYVRAVLAGDGAGYVFSPLGIWPTGTTKQLRDGFKSNSVAPLPADPGAAYPLVTSDWIEEGEAVMIVTDGIGDDMLDGSTDVAGFLYRELASPVPPHRLLECVSYIRYQSGDDRSVFIVWA